MNFLEMCNRVRARAPVPGSALTSLTGISGIRAMIPIWVNEAVYKIENHREDWPWMRVSFSFDTSPDKAQYTVEELSIDNVHNLWDMRVVRAVQGDLNFKLNSELTYLDGEEYLYDTTTNQPSHIYISHDGSTVNIYPVPDGVFTIYLPYYRLPDDLVETTDEVLIPAKWHDAIVFEAQRAYAVYDESPAHELEAIRNYNLILSQMELGLDKVRLRPKGIA